MGKKQSKQVKKDAPIDTKAGSRSYNRFEMQISQTLHMAIELYSDLNYLFVLDHYDDITLFDNDISPESVSYYQMKTSEDSISIDTAISQDWIAKLYEQLSNPAWFVKELGLITNCPLKVTVKFNDDDIISTKIKAGVGYMIALRQLLSIRVLIELNLYTTT